MAQLCELRIVYRRCWAGDDVSRHHPTAFQGSALWFDPTYVTSICKTSRPPLRLISSFPPRHKNVALATSASDLFIGRGCRRERPVPVRAACIASLLGRLSCSRSSLSADVCSRVKWRRYQYCIYLSLWIATWSRTGTLSIGIPWIRELWLAALRPSFKIHRCHADE